MNQSFKAFASDNYASVHPDIIRALSECNRDHAEAYGDDKYTKRAKELFRNHFGEHVEVLFVFNGTGANMVGLDSISNSFQSILAWENAHIYADECGAIEKITGCRITPISSTNGKLSKDLLSPHLTRLGVVHHSQPAIVSISQSTEYGTVYSLRELKELADFVHSHNMYLHLDGARIANAAASLSCTLRQLVTQTGVDVLSFGGTKNGMMFGEGVVVLNPQLADKAKYYQKQNGQLPSKQRFISAQFIALFENDLWLSNARHANAMAKRLYHKIATVPEVRITQSVDANVIFAQLKREHIDYLLESFKFYVWDEKQNEVRWMTSFDTKEDEVDTFAEKIHQIRKIF